MTSSSAHAVPEGMTSVPMGVRGFDGQLIVRAEAPLAFKESLLVSGQVQTPRECCAVPCLLQCCSALCCVLFFSRYSWAAWHAHKVSFGIWGVSFLVVLKYFGCAQILRKYLPHRIICYVAR